MVRPRIGVRATCWCISQKNQVGLEQMLKLLLNFLIFLMVNTFHGGGGHSIVTLSSNDQNSSLICICSILVALSSPLKVQNFKPTPLPTSINQLYKYKQMFSWMFLMPSLYIWYQLFRFQVSKLYVRYRQFAFVSSLWYL